MKYLIAGLGNIGFEYKNTRHNIGFKVLDAFADASNFLFKSKRYGDIAEFRFKGRNLIFLKPSTYMNLSGKALNYWLYKEKIPLDKLLVIVDDVALPFGTLRIRPRGGDGGHNGLEHIIQVFGTQNFPRLRFGIGNEFPHGQQVNYVLGEWTEEEEKALKPRTEVCFEIIKSFVFNGLERTMNMYNNR